MFHMQITWTVILTLDEGFIDASYIYIYKNEYLNRHLLMYVIYPS